MFTISGWIIVTIIGYIVIYFFAGLIGECFRSTAGKVIGALSAFIVMAIVCNVVYYAMSTSIVVENRSATNKEVAEKLFGFKPDTPYPLVLGSQVSTFAATAEANAGFFSADSSIDISGGAAITVSFVSDGITYTMSLPRALTPIQIDDSKRPEMVIRFKQRLNENVNEDPVDIAATGVYFKQLWSDCEFVISNLAAACKRTETFASEMTVSAQTRNAGLATLVEDSFESASLTMTSAMYDQLIGRIK